MKVVAPHGSSDDNKTKGYHAGFVMNEQGLETPTAQQQP